MSSNQDLEQRIEELELISMVIALLYVVLGVID